jgi:hypothetical protein
MLEKASQEGPSNYILVFANKQYNLANLTEKGKVLCLN